MLRCEQLEAVLVCFGEIFVDYRPTNVLAVTLLHTMLH